MDRMTQQLVWRDVYLIAHRDPDATALYTHLLTSTGEMTRRIPRHETAGLQSSSSAQHCLQPTAGADLTRAALAPLYLKVLH